MFWARVVLILFCLLDGLLASQLIWGDKGAMDYVHLRRTYSRLVAETEALDQHNLILSETIRSLKNNPAYMARVVRAELNFVGDKDIVYLFEPEGKAPVPHSERP